MSNTQTVDMINGSTRRINLPKPAWEGREEIGTGLFRTAIYVGAKSKRVVVRTVSQWQKRNSQESVGVEYHEASNDECADLADEHDEVADAIDAIIGVEEL